MDTLSSVMKAGGGLLSAYGSYEQGEATGAAAEYNAGVDLQNAQLARQQAKEEERRSRVQSTMQLGNMRANYGASGVTTEGSPLEIMEQSARTAELDALTIRHQGEVKAIGYENSAKLNQIKAKQGKKSGGIGVAADLLGAAASLAVLL